MIKKGDALDELLHLPDNSVDLVCTDPPYGFSFMNKDWDKAVPSVEIWQECLRVLKPGAFCMVMSAPRSDVQMHMVQNLTEAGFRLDFTPIYWTYASGFPKAGNIGKMVDKRLGAERVVLGQREDFKKRARKNGVKSKDYVMAGGWESTEETVGIITAPATDQAKALDGSYAGFQPKPAVEVIIVAMKPLSEKTFVDQALKNGKGITWLDDCRVPTETGADLNGGGYRGVRDDFNGTSFNMPGTGKEFVQPQGRFPANLLVSDDVLNDGVERKSNGNHEIEGYDATPNGVYGKYPKRSSAGHTDSGSYSRYFDLDKWASTLPFLIVPKASKREKNEGLEDFEEKEMGRHQSSLDGGKMLTGSGNERSNAKKNHHPTVKPLKLMSYLITLGSRKGDTVLDPFCGSGTTCIAAKKLDREFIGIEREAEYVEIAEARLKHLDRDKQMELV